MLTPEEKKEIKSKPIAGEDLIIGKVYYYDRCLDEWGKLLKINALGYAFFKPIKTIFYIIESDGLISFCSKGNFYLKNKCTNPKQ